MEAVVYPENGGCWYCYKDTEPLVFDTEFDTFVHLDCIIKALKDDPEDEEANLMRYLLE